MSDTRWVCDGCKTSYAEYVNGCPRCWEHGLTFSVRVAPSTPAPQGEKCAHAPEIPEDLKEMYDCCVKLMETREDYGFLPSTPFVLIERIALAESTLARERESRKQAEAALREVDGTLCECRYDDDEIDCNCDLHAAHKIIAAALSKPIPQESRKQAEDQAFNAGIEAAAERVRDGSARSAYSEIGAIHAKWVRALSKPIQEPAEREPSND